MLALVFFMRGDVGRKLRISAFLICVSQHYTPDFSASSSLMQMSFRETCMVRDNRQLIVVLFRLAAPAIFKKMQSSIQRYYLPVAL